jgi:hypothetical protein
MVAHICNLSYLGDWDLEDHGSRPAPMVGGKVNEICSH